MHEAAAAAWEQLRVRTHHKQQQPPCSASGMKRAAAIRRLQSCAYAERGSRSTHTPLSSRGAFYLSGPSQSIARGSWRAMDPHIIHEQRHMSGDRPFNPFFPRFTWPVSTLFQHSFTNLPLAARFESDTSRIPAWFSWAKEQICCT